MKKFTINVIVAFLSKVLIILSAIIAQNFILRSFGSEINGLTSSITQFITYFTLLEAGLGTASIQALYAPLNNQDTDIINSIISATNQQYKKIGVTFSILTVFLAFLMPLITNSSLNYFLIVGITILMGGASVINYFFVGKFNTLLYADRNVYIINILDCILGVTFSFLKVIIINLGGSIFIVLSTQIVSPMIRTFILWLYIKIKYPYINFRATPKKEYISKRWSVLVHQVVGMITHHTDVVILSISDTLSMVSVYSVYNYIYSNINGIMQTTLLTAPQASFGKLYNSDSKETFNKMYDIFECFVTYFVFMIVAVAICLTIPFVTLYTKGVTDVNYIDYILGVLFALSILFSTIRIPSLMMVNIVGKFKETQKGTIIEAVVNIVASIPLYFILGIRGLLIGTCLAMLYRAIDIIIYSYKNIVFKKLISILKLIIIYLIFGVTFVFMINRYLNYIPISWIEFVIYAMIVFVLGCIWFALPIVIFYRKYLVLIIQAVKRKFKRG